MRRRPHPQARLTGLAFAAAIALAGCGGGGDAEPTLVSRATAGATVTPALSADAAYVAYSFYPLGGGGPENVYRSAVDDFFDRAGTETPHCALVSRRLRA